MARINIEDQFWDDVGEIAGKVGDHTLACGMAIKFIRFAQQEHRRGRLISEEDFAERFHEALIPVFAKRTRSGIEAKGAKHHFAWLDQKVEAGKKGGRSKTEAKSKHLKQNARKYTEAKPSGTEASISNSISSSNSPCLAISEKSPTENIVSIYCDLWKARNGKSPDIRGKEAGQLKQLEKDVGLPRAKEIIRSYFSMPDPMFIKRGYDVGTMLLNLAAIAQFEANGKVVTKKVATDLEERIDKAQGTDRKSMQGLIDLIDERERAKIAGQT